MRSLLAIALFSGLLLGLFVPGQVHAASPASGTLSQANPAVSWTGGPVTPTAAGCAGPEDPGVRPLPAHHRAAGRRGGLHGAHHADAARRLGPERLRPQRLGRGELGQSAGDRRDRGARNPVAGVHTVSGAPFAVGAPYSATAVFELGAPPPPPPPPGSPGGQDVPVRAAGGDRRAAPASPRSASAGWARSTSRTRRMYIAGLEVLRVTRDECLSDSRQETDLWVDKTAPNNGLATLDPILFTDFRTGRTFASQLGPKCSLMSFSDDDGESWLPSQGCGINAGVDHQSVGGGPFPASDPIGGIGYPNAVYYCSQDAAIAQCALSRDGGLTFGPAIPIYNVTQCGGLHGHVKVGAGRHGLRPQQELPGAPGRRGVHGFRHDLDRAHRAGQRVGRDRSAHGHRAGQQGLFRLLGRLDLCRDLHGPRPDLERADQPRRGVRHRQQRLPRGRGRR